VPRNGIVHGFRPLAPAGLIRSEQVAGHLEIQPRRLCGRRASKMLMQAHERLLEAIGGIVVRQPKQRKVAVEWVAKLVEDPATSCTTYSLKWSNNRGAGFSGWPLPRRAEER